MQEGYGNIQATSDFRSKVEGPFNVSFAASANQDSADVMPKPCNGKNRRRDLLYNGVRFRRHPKEATSLFADCSYDHQVISSFSSAFEDFFDWFPGLYDEL